MRNGLLTGDTAITIFGSGTFRKDGISLKKTYIKKTIDLSCTSCAINGFSVGWSCWKMTPFLIVNIVKKPDCVSSYFLDVMEW